MLQQVFCIHFCPGKIAQALSSYGTMSRQRLKSVMDTAQMEKQHVSIQSKKLSERIQSQMTSLVAQKTQSQQRIIELSNELQQTKDRASKIQKELRSVIVRLPLCFEVACAFIILSLRRLGRATQSPSKATTKSWKT